MRRPVLAQIRRDARPAAAMEIVVQKGGHERTDRIARAPEPARTGRAAAARLAELVSEPVRCSRGPGVDSRASVRAFIAAAVDATRGRASGGVAGVQGEMARRRRARAAASADPPAPRTTAARRPETPEVASLSL